MDEKNLKYYFDQSTLDNAADCLMFETPLGRKVRDFNDKNFYKLSIRYSYTDNSISIWQQSPQCMQLARINYTSVPTLIRAVKKGLKIAIDHTKTNS